jgi:hypothetical protein
VVHSELPTLGAKALLGRLGVGVHQIGIARVGVLKNQLADVVE